MSELRRDPISGEWVIIAAERKSRPDAFRPACSRDPVAATKDCPFCPGREKDTPPEVHALRSKESAADGPGWSVRVISNKFPAMDHDKAVPKTGKEEFFHRIPGYGFHEVVIDSPDHKKEFGDLPVESIRDVFLTIQERIRVIEKDPGCRYVQVFKNKGREAGATLSHSHTQILSTPVVPDRIFAKWAGAERWFRKTGTCGYCRLLEEETSGEAPRLVLRTGHFAAFVPFASRFPFATTVFPLRHSPFFTAAGTKEITALAEILKEILSRMNRILCDPPYNLVLYHMSRSNAGASFHWYFEISPVTTNIAGYEIGTGMFINPVSPEAAAEIFRKGSP